MQKFTMIATLALLVSGLASADCGSIGSAPATAPAPAPVVAPIKELTTVVINEEGEHLLADSSAKTLYVFDLDLDKPTSVCNGDCAEMWPPALLTAEEAKDLKAPLGSVVRANKKLQLTYNGRPVYNYAMDRGAAADAGDGVGDVWHYVELQAK